MEDPVKNEGTRPLSSSLLRIQDKYCRILSQAQDLSVSCELLQGLYAHEATPAFVRTHSKTCITFLFHHIGEGNGTPLQYSCLENPMDGGAW